MSSCCVAARRAASAAEHRAKLIIARVNQALYTWWGVICLCREGPFALMVASFFRGCPPAPIVTPLSQVGIGLGSVTATWEMVVTTILQIRVAGKYRQTTNKISTCKKKRDAFALYMEYKKEARKGPANQPLPQHILNVQQDIKAHAKHYFKYETAQIDLGKVSQELKTTSIAFGRDTLVQGGGVGCNLALLWQALNVSQLLHIAVAPINVIAAAIGGFAFSIGCGVLHIVAGAVTIYDGMKALAAAIAARETVGKSQGKLARLKARGNNAAARFAARLSKQKPGNADKYHKLQAGVSADDVAQFAQALEVSETLLLRAGKNEDEAKDEAQRQMFVGRARIGYGTVAVACGAASLVLFLMIGTGGLFLAAVGAMGLLAAGAWVLYASYRNRTQANLLQAALTQTGAAPASGEANVAPPGPDDPINQAFAILDRQEGAGQHPLARKLIKHTLIRIGMAPSDFRPLKSAPAEVRDIVQAELKIKIRNHIAGDGIRRARAS